MLSVLSFSQMCYTFCLCAREKAPTTKKKQARFIILSVAKIWEEGWGGGRIWWFVFLAVLKEEQALVNLGGGICLYQTVSSVSRKATITPSNTPQAPLQDKCFLKQMNLSQSLWAKGASGRCGFDMLLLWFRAQRARSNPASPKLLGKSPKWPTSKKTNKHKKSIFEALFAFLLNIPPVWAGPSCSNCGGVLGLGDFDLSLAPWIATLVKHHKGKSWWADKNPKYW